MNLNEIQKFLVPSFSNRKYEKRKTEREEKN